MLDSNTADGVYQPSTQWYPLEENHSDLAGEWFLTTTQVRPKVKPKGVYYGQSPRLSFHISGKPRFPQIAGF